MTREQLLGYLLNALDAFEREDVDLALEGDLALRSDLERMAAALPPLAADRGTFDPPADLAERTCRAVAACVGQNVGHVFNVPYM